MAKRKISRKGVVKKLDTITSLYIRARDKRCVLCGTTERLNNGHVFTRSNYSTRWDITEDGNCHTQCITCNYNHERSAKPYYEWYVGRFGQAKFDELFRRWNTTSKLSTPQLEELYLTIKEAYAKLEP